MSIICPFLTSGNRSLQCRSLFVRLRSSQWRNICRAHSTVSFVQHTVLRCPPSAAVVRSCVRPSITSAYLPHLFTGVRWFSDNDREKNDNGENIGLRGFVFRVPNPLSWLKDRWFTYRIQSLVDSSFNLREFQTGAKQVRSLIALSAT